MYPSKLKKNTKSIDRIKNLYYYRSMFKIIRSGVLDDVVKKNQNLTAEIQNLTAEIQNLNVQFTQFRAQQNRDELKYSANRFYTYPEWIRNIHMVCAGKDDFGIKVVALIYLRAGFVAGTIEIKHLKPEKVKEKYFIDEFLKYNGLNTAGMIELLADVDKEAKILLSLRKTKKLWTWKADKDGGDISETDMVAVNYMPWGRYNYTAIPDEQNNKKAKAIMYKSKNGLVTLEANQFVYDHYRGGVSADQFGGNIADDYGNVAMSLPGKEDFSNDINTAMPVYWACWENIVGLEKSLTDFRNNNHLFSAPKPVIRCRDASQARETDALINANTGGINFKSRSSMVVAAEEIKYLTPEDKASIENEIKLHIQAISMATGIPPNELGRDDELRTKATSETQMEGLGASIFMDRQKAQNWLNELKDKAMEMMNGEKTPLDPTAVEIKICGTTQSDWDRLVAFYLPAREKGLISQFTFLDNVPGLDTEEETKRLEEQKEEEQKEKDENRDEFFQSMIDNRRAEEIEENKEENEENEENEKEVLNAKGRFGPKNKRS